MHVALIQPFTVEIIPVDTTTTVYDADFTEPARVSTGSGAGNASKAVGATYSIQAQVEEEDWRKSSQYQSGNSPTSTLVAVAHFRDLEAAGLVDDAGNAKIRIGDALGRILDVNGNVVLTPVEPLYITQVRAAGFGLGRLRNLVFVHFESRGAGVPRDIRNRG